MDEGPTMIRPLAVLVCAAMALPAQSPTMVIPGLEVSPVVSGLLTPVSLAFTGPGAFLLLEKNSGKVLRVANGTVQGTALDLAVNAGSERGLLGIALHPDFPVTPYVYLYWTCRAPAGTTDATRPWRCTQTPDLGPATPDTMVLGDVPVLGNRVDRFVYQSGTLTFDRNLIMLRAFQHDPTPSPVPPFDPQPMRGNHDGGVILFGADRKLYILIGDVGRRGQLQNLPLGPTAATSGAPMADDQFGGPEPDDAHFTGVIIRLNDDGSTPVDNPFYAFNGSLNTEVNANVRKIFSYGVRNSFGMAVDPLSGNLWLQENGEDAFDELYRVEPGMNSGWIQIAGPAGRVAEYRLIETTALHHESFPNLQQFRWGPENISTTAQQAKARLFTLPGSRYKDPEFSWKFVLAPAGMGFLNSRALGPQFEGDLFMGFSVPEPLGGPLFRFQLTGNRRKIGTDDPRLADGVADNLTFHDITESESLLAGINFGIVTDVDTAPDGTLYVVSLDKGTVYRIFRK